MISKLVLVRHGKAQDPTDGVPDELRTLTSTGKRTCRAWYKRTLRPLLRDEAPAIWASPAKRALQTADILREALDATPVVIHDALYGESAYAIADELATAEGCVVLVGHDPFISELFAQLTGVPLHFGKGAAASLALSVPAGFAEEAEGGVPTPSAFPPASATRGRTTRKEPGLDQMEVHLDWFVQGPDHARWKTLAQLEKALRRAAARIEDAAADLLAHPDDVETLHQYRVALRIARSLTSFLRGWLDKDFQRKTDSELKALQTPTSHVREMDIVLDVVEPGSAQAMLCARERYEVRIEFIEQLQDEASAKALRRACKRLRSPRWRKAVETHGVGRDELAARLRRMQCEQELNLSKLDYADQESVHDIRKRAKALRYAAREFSSCLPEGSGQVSSSMKAVQEKLGELCDAWVNEELVTRLCGDDAAEIASDLRAEADELIAELEEGRNPEPQAPRQPPQPQPARQPQRPQQPQPQAAPTAPNTCSRS